MKLEAIPPYIVRLFPQAVGIKVGDKVRVVRDQTQRIYQVDAIILPENCPISRESLESGANLGEILSKAAPASASYAMRRGILLYLIVVKVHRVDSDWPPRIFHPACLCLASKK